MTSGSGSRSDGGAGYRSYEVFQRQRVHEATNLVVPGALQTTAFCDDPHALLTVLREHYPCYRDWSGNSFWITRYDDVTSVLTDDASFAARTRRWHAGLDGAGRDLSHELPVWEAWVRGIDEHVVPATHEALDAACTGGRAELAMGVAARIPLSTLARALALPAGEHGWFAERYLRLHRGVGWEPVARGASHAAFGELVERFTPLVEERRRSPGDDLVSAVASCEVDGAPASARDLVVTLLEREHETLHGSLANLWFLLLTHPDQMEAVGTDRRLLMYAHLEALRHSAPVLAGLRYALREVERFGRLLPHGSLVVCSAAAANRDPRVFTDPDTFDVFRADLCRREARGQYRADGLPTAIAPGLGTPSHFPALPTDRPRSWFAVTRDAVVAATGALLDRLPGLRLAEGATPRLRSLRLGEMYTCWVLPVVHGRTRP